MAGIKQMLVAQQSQSACRFLTVDAYRAAVPFYEKNGFKMLVNEISDDAITERLTLLSSDHKFAFYRSQGLDLLEY